MSPVRIAVLAAAAIAAIALAFVARGMMAPKPAPTVEAAKPMAQVLIAKRDLVVGTRLKAEDMGWQAWPVDALNPSLITDGGVPTTAPQKGAEDTARKAAKATTDLVLAQGPLHAFEGSIVKEPIASGEPIIARKVVRGGQSGVMAVVLTPGMQAMAVPINAESAAGGFILPGDRVDVLQSHATSDNKGFVSETLMRNLRVLAIDQHTDAGKDGAASLVGAVAVLEVPAGDAEVLSRGKAQGEMQLALRSYADLGGGAIRGGPSQRGGPDLRLFRGGKPVEVHVR
jgi:pilus assembly protein CpaB